MLSKTAYEALPFAYIAGGVLCVSLLESPLKLLPGISLVAAGFLVLLWRRAARAHQRRQREISRRCHQLQHRDEELALLQGDTPMRRPMGQRALRS